VNSVWNKNIADEPVCLLKQKHQAHEYLDQHMSIQGLGLVITIKVYAKIAEVTDPGFVSDWC